MKGQRAARYIAQEQGQFVRERGSRLGLPLGERLRRIEEICGGVNQNNVHAIRSTPTGVVIRFVDGSKTALSFI